MPLVEVIRRAASDPTAVATAMKLVKDLRKTPVLVGNRPGFVVNRLFIPYLKEAFRLLEDGAEATAIDAAMVDFGFAMGPLTLIDMAGIDVLALTDKHMCEGFDHHEPLSAVAVSLVEQGSLGQKTGAGVYLYEPGDYTPKDSPATRRIIADVQAQSGRSAREIDATQISDRLVMRMVAEAFCVVQDQIAQRQSDIDVAMVLGTGFPDFRGGPLRYAEQYGVDRVVNLLDRLAGAHGERFKVCEYLREMTGA